MIINFFVLLVLHVIGDFYLQSDKLSKCKQAQIDDACSPCEKCNNKKYFNFSKIIIHSALCLIPYFLGLLLFWVPIIDGMIFLASVFVAHILIDSFTCWVKKYLKHTLAFLIDQALHVIIIYILVRNLFDDVFLNEGYANLIIFGLVVLLLVKPIAIFINNLYYDLFGTNITSSFDTGIIIGIFERLIVVTLFYLGAVSAIALIIGAKTWVRYGEIKEDNQFRTKYLVGTLASIGLALVLCVFAKRTITVYFS
jgi:hypothetical protein